MKYLTFFTILFSLFTPQNIAAQQCSDYPCVIKKVKRFIADKKYTDAFDNLESADGYPAKKADEISALRKQLFAAIEKEKNEAKKARVEAEKAKKVIEQKTQELEKVIAKNQKIINALYFYKDKYALVHHYSEVGEYAVGEYLIGEYNNLESGFYFIDKNGDESMKGKSFPIALPFNESIGFAKVKQNESDNFYSLLDTLGNVYPLATKLEHLKDTITALDLSNNGIVELPSSLYQNIHLKILLLCDNKITTLNSDIKAMSNLILLNLKGNIISKEEQETIKKLLPNCEIQF